jgi:hypothetical protein
MYNKLNNFGKIVKNSYGPVISSTDNISLVYV